MKLLKKACYLLLFFLVTSWIGYVGLFASSEWIIELEPEGKFYKQSQSGRGFTLSKSAELRRGDRVDFKKVELTFGRPNAHIPETRYIQKNNRLLKNKKLLISDLTLIIDRLGQNSQLYFTAKTKSSIYRLETEKTLFYFNLEFTASKEEKPEENIKWNYKTGCISILPNSATGRVDLDLEAPPSEEEKKRFNSLKQVKLSLHIQETPTAVVKELESGGGVTLTKLLLSSEKTTNFIKNHRKGVAMVLVLLPILLSAQTLWYVVRNSSCLERKKVLEKKKKGVA